MWAANQPSPHWSDTVIARSQTPSGSVRLVPPRGAYPADRAAALSGVPKTTLHWWARNEILIPSVSPERVKLWGYSDLMAARIIHWLRRPKTVDEDGAAVPRSTMPAVRRALAQLAELDMALWTEETGPSVLVDRAGAILVTTEPTLERGDRQRRFASADGDAFDVLAPFPTSGGARGPDLVAPRPQLRIVPGKLGGAPHVLHTRLESQALAALADSGLPTAKIYRLYPDVAQPGIDEALDLERQLVENLRRAA
jgi:uncharacterized protein (DUF433 family)